jgi:hypothetical protein
MPANVTFAIILIFARLAYFGSAIALFGASLFEFYVGEAAGAPTRTLSRASRLAMIVVTGVSITSTIAWLVTAYIDTTGGDDSLFQRETWAAFFVETSFCWVWIRRASSSA